MKKIFILSLMAFICSGALFSYSVYNSKKMPTLFLADVEALSDGEGGDVIQCRCSATPYVGNKRCKASNEGSLCAQSEAGGNIHCEEYDANC